MCMSWYSHMIDGGGINDHNLIKGDFELNFFFLKGMGKLVYLHGWTKFISMII